MALRPTTMHGGEAAPAAPAQTRAPSGFGAAARGGHDGPYPGRARRGIRPGGAMPADAPRTSADAASAGPGAVSPRPPPGRSAGAARAGGEAPDGDTDAGETVLMAEDDAIVRMVAADVLREAGYRVLEAPDGLAALDVVRSGERVDLLLTDMGLPGMDGRRLAEAARRLRPGLRVLFVTGDTCDAAGEGPLPPGTQVIGKPVALDVLAAKVRAMLAA